MFNGSNISVTTTAIARPEIVEQTFSSFNDNLRKMYLKEIDLFLNIDRIPDNWKIIRQVEEVAKKFFRTVYSRVPNKPNLSLALDWTWRTAETDYILNLEDDWILTEPIDTLSIYNSFQNDPTLVQVALRAYTYDYNNRIIGGPSFLSKNFYKSFAGKFAPNIVAEIQLRNRQLWPFKKVKQLVCGDFPVVKDIGRKWLDEQKLVKPEKFGFTTYANVDEYNFLRRLPG